MKQLTKIISFLLAACLIMLTACSKDNSTQTTADNTTYETVQDTTAYIPVESTSLTAPVSETTSTEVTSLPPVTNAPETAPPVTNAPVTVPVTEAPTTAIQPANAYSSYTKSQVLSLLTAAVNKTKSYKNDITVHHVENFDLDVKNVTPGGTLTKNAINFVVGLVVKPGEEDYKFSNGTATTSEGETTQLLLPKAAAFSLTEKGVKSATAEQSGNKVHVVLTLNAEECNSLSDVPKYNASSIGYLDLDGKFNTLEITNINISYPGSVIDAYINSDGYVTSVTYTIYMNTHGEASALGINGSADFVGTQSEKWEIKW